MLGSVDRKGIAQWILEMFQKSPKVFHHWKRIEEKVKAEFNTNESFVRQCLKTFVSSGIIKFSGVNYKGKYIYQVTTDANEDKTLDLFGEENEIPLKTVEYLDDYGFDSLVASISKQVDRNGTIVKTYSTDRLWMMPYVYFLNLCREYKSWRDSEIALSKKELSDFKRKSKK